MTEVSSDTSPEPDAQAPELERPAWVGSGSSPGFPLVLLNPGSRICSAWLAFRVFPYREHVVRENLAKAFPDLDETALRKVMRAYYDGFAQMFVELLKGATMPAAEIKRRVRIVNPR